MRKVVLITVLLILYCAAFGQNGCNFESLTFNEALVKAKTENKLVFVDCYTSWCGPCKQMSDKVFPMKKMGDFLNPKFVCIKIDMEKGEGIKLAKQFNIKAYPTFLILRADGTEQHRIVGGSQADDFIKKVERGFSKKTSLSYLERKKQQKEGLNKKQLATYRLALIDAGEKEKSEVVRKKVDSLLTKRDKMKKDYWSFVEKSIYGSPDFKLILNNLSTFKKRIGSDDLNKYISRCYMATLYGPIRPTMKELKKISDEINNYDFDACIKTRFTRLIEINIAMRENNVKNFFDLANQVKEKQDALDVLGAVSVYQSEVSKDMLNQMLSLEKKYLNIIGEEKDVNRFFYELRAKAYIGIYFQDLGYDEALALAKKFRKKIFIDCYTTWCGPCRHMSETVFKQEEVGDYMNQRFICIKIDMEKKEGIELAQKFAVSSYPTFFIINSDGTLCHKFIGKHEKEGFIKKVSEAFDNSKALGMLESKYLNGNRDKKFLIQYMKILMNNNDPQTQKILDELLSVSTDEDKISQDYWFIFENQSLSPNGSDVAKFLVDNRNKFYQTIGKEIVDKRLNEGYFKEVLDVITGFGQGTDIKRLDDIGQEIKKLDLANKDVLLSFLPIAKAVKTRDFDKILTACEKEFPKLGKDVSTIDFLLSRFVFKATDKQKARWKKLCQMYGKY